MNLQEIKQAVDDGKIVCWASENYRVIKDRLNQWLIVCQINGYTVGLTWADGKTLNCNSEDEFFILENL